MPPLNQVDPYGTRYASDGTKPGLFTGNHLGRSSPRLCCSIDPAWYRERAYTRLFFLDEATALSAGHRPCNRCRRDQKDAFVSAWKLANGSQTMKQIDAAIRSCRSTFPAARLDSLPAGTMYDNSDDPNKRGGPRVRVDGGSLLWSASGYSDFQPADNSIVTLLTAKPIIATFMAGYLPALHPSAHRKTIP